MTNLSRNAFWALAIFMSFNFLTLQLNAQPYKGSIGFRTGYYGNIGLSGKVFLKENKALEVIFTTRKYSSFFNYRYNEIGGILKSQQSLESLASGLTWYFGGGGYYGFYNDGYAAKTVSLTAVGGLEYTISKIPLTVSLDFGPRYFLSSNLYWSGFSVNSGGLRVAYAFGGGSKS